jgi:hypothetical protein
MTIIVPYKTDILSDVELLYALRSIEKNLIGFTNLIIIGTPPDWYKGESVYAKDHVRGKQYSIYSKLLIACELSNVTDYFIEWDDDVMLNKDLLVGALQYYQDGTIKDHLKKGDMGSRYREAVANTLQIIPDGVHFDLHNPIIYNKSQFKKLFCNKTDETIIKSYYCNALKIEGVHRDDCKINQLISKGAIYYRIKDCLFFSTTTNAMKKPMIDVLSELYPNKSQWEK